LCRTCRQLETQAQEARLQKLSLILAPGACYSWTIRGALRTATINPAVLLGKEQEIGSVEAGFFADIIAVKGNPLQDISLVKQVVFVMKEGVVIKAPSLK